MRIVVIGAAPTGLGVAYRLHQLQNNNLDVAKNVELIVLEKVSNMKKIFLLISKICFKHKASRRISIFPFKLFSTKNFKHIA